MTVRLQQHRDHSRHWRDNLYVYPVISRRSRGLSIGINLNPDTACNFDCVYCQVDRTVAPQVRRVDVDVVRDELERMIDDVQTGALFDGAPFETVSKAHRSIRDIAFSGDGEPTTCKQFGECVDVVARAKAKAGLADTRIVLITDACYLTKPDVEAALCVMDANQGEIWAKLDAGTEAYYQTVNRPNHPLVHVIDNIIAAAKVRPVVIQSIFMRLRGTPPDKEELTAYAGRLRDIVTAGGRIDRVQVYTVARPPAEAFVTPLSDEEVDHIAAIVRDQVGLRAEAFYS